MSGYGTDGWLRLVWQWIDFIGCGLYDVTGIRVQGECLYL